MALSPSVAGLGGGFAVTHTGDPVTIIDYPSYVSIFEWAGTQSSAFGVSPILVYPPIGTGVAQAYGSSTTDDSLAINAALAALNGTGISLYFPPATYLVSANAIVNAGNVPCIFAPNAIVTGTNASSLLTQTKPFYARAVMTTVATSTTYAGTGTNTITFGSNAAFGTQDGVATLAVGDVVILQGGTLGSCAITAKDTGPWVISSLGGASAKAVLVRPSWWQTGANMPVGQTIQVGTEGTVFHGTVWRMNAGPGLLVGGSTDPKWYPDQVSLQVTLASSSFTLATIPLLSATASTVVCSLAAVGGTTTSTVGYGLIAAPTAGYVGTVTMAIVAQAAGMTKNGTSDTSIVSVLLTNNSGG